MAGASPPKSIGLMGSGEFLPWAEEFDRRLIERATVRSPRVLVLPTASAPEGDHVFDRWGTMGLEHYRRMDLEPEVVALKTRDDALRPELAAKVAGAGLVFFSGGNPRYLVDTLAETPFWAAVLEAIDAGTAFGGCSAGVACLGERAPDSSRENFGPDVWGPGLRFFPGTEFAPHWDALDRYQPGLRRAIRDSFLPDTLHVLIDEETGCVGDGDTFTVVGRSRVTVEFKGEEVAHAEGETFRLSDARPAG